MSGTPAKIAVLITCHNRAGTTLECLRRLRESARGLCGSVEVFLVDDGSSDGTPEKVRTEFPQVNIIAGTGHLYWNQGMRLAWTVAARSAAFDFFFWLNDDTALFEGALTKMLRLAKALKSPAIICGSTVSATTGMHTYGGYDDHGKLIGRPGFLEPCQFFNGNAVLVPREVFQTVGLLDVAFTHALGDFDYGRRARNLGIECLVAPEYVGYCEQHSRLPIWMRPETKLLERFRQLYKPLGCNPFEFFIFDRRRSGMLLASIHFISLHLRALFPQLWLLKNAE